MRFFIIFNLHIWHFLCKEHQEFVCSQTLHVMVGKWKKTGDHYLNFADWFEERVGICLLVKKWLSKRPNMVVQKFSSYKINGYKFMIESCETITQNSGMMVTSSTTHE